MASDLLVTDYLRLGLAFDRLEEGFVDAYTGDPTLRAQIAAAPAPEPAQLARRARELAAELPADLDADRAAFVGAHLRALECSARKFAGEEIGFVDEVSAYFDVDIAMGDEQTYRQAHADLAVALGVDDATDDRLRLQLRATGATWQHVADQLGYRSRQAAQLAVRRYLDAHQPDPDAERGVTSETLRLLTSTLFNQLATARAAGDSDAVVRISKEIRSIGAESSKLNGLYRPG